MEGQKHPNGIGVFISLFILLSHFGPYDRRLAEGHFLPGPNFFAGAIAMTLCGILLL